MTYFPKEDLDSKFPLAIVKHVLYLLRDKNLPMSDRLELEKVVIDIAAFAQHTVDHELHKGGKKGKRAPKAEPVQETLFEEPEEEEVPKEPKRRGRPPKKVQPQETLVEKEKETEEEDPEPEPQPEKHKKFKNPHGLLNFQKKG
jgi:cell division septation protein DedD